MTIAVDHRARKDLKDEVPFFSPDTPPTLWKLPLIAVAALGASIGTTLSLAFFDAPFFFYGILPVLGVAYLGAAAFSGFKAVQRWQEMKERPITLGDFIHAGAPAAYTVMWLVAAVVAFITFVVIA